MMSQYYPPKVGGLDNHVYELSKALVRLRHEVHVVTCSTEWENSHELVDGVHIHRLGFRLRIHKLRWWLFIWDCHRYLQRLINEYDIELIHVHGHEFDADRVRFFKGKIPIIFTNHSSGYLMEYETEEGRKKLKKRLSFFDFIVAPSEELRQKSEILINPTSTAYIPNGVDTSKFVAPKDKTAIRKVLGLAVEELIFLCPRRLAPKNGVKYFVESARYLNSDLKLTYVVVGGGFPDERKKLEEIVKGNCSDDKITFVGTIPNEQMQLYMQASDVVVLPSLMEATSVAGLEAMSTGLPLIGTNVGGIPAIIANGCNGIIVEPKQPKELAEAVIKLATSEALRRKMGEYGRDRAEKEFDWKIIAEKLVNLAYKIALQKQ